MAIEFFDKLTASVSRTAKQVSDNAKTLADKNRIRKDIAAFENELRNRYRDIGEKYFTETCDNPAPDYAEMFTAINELKASLEAKQHELEALEGSVACPECGRPIMIGSKFCPNCGASAPAVQAPAQAPAAVQPICQFCGQALAADALFCAACGNKVPEQPAQPAAPVAPEVPAQPVQNVCPNCGEVLSPDALFCAVCGTKAPGVD
ncbi:MAG: zinc ribbon domain-containing protein [Oscillospiraceae bacterium]|nr:zinc ribbon domain-containing protein [Oscillospiraceae bacterium]